MSLFPGDLFELYKEVNYFVQLPGATITLVCSCIFDTKLGLFIICCKLSFGSLILKFFITFGLNEVDRYIKKQNQDDCK